MLTKRYVELSLILAASFLAGCLTVESGHDFDMTKAQTFQKGHTTRTEVIAALGEPTSSGTNSDGSYIEYLYQNLSQGGSPLAYLGVGTTNVQDKVKKCRFSFNAQGVLTDTNCSEGSPDYSNFGK